MKVALRVVLSRSLSSGFLVFTGAHAPFFLFIRFLSLRSSARIRDFRVSPETMQTTASGGGGFDTRAANSGGFIFCGSPIGTRRRSAVLKGRGCGAGGARCARAGRLYTVARNSSTGRGRASRFLHRVVWRYYDTGRAPSTFRHLVVGNHCVDKGQPFGGLLVRGKTFMS